MKEEQEVTAKAGDGKGFFYGYVIVGALCLITATANAMVYNCASIFYAPVSKDFGVSTGAFAIYFSCLCLSATVTLIVAGRLFDRYNVKWILSGSSAIVGLTVAAMSRFTEVWHFYAAGIIIGVCEAFIMYLAAAVLINRWFKIRTGFFLGLVSAFSGAGGVVFNQIGGRVMAASGWRQTYFVFGVIILAVSVPCSLLLAGHPKDKGQQPYGETGGTDAGKPQAITGVSYMTAIKSMAFVMSILFGLLVCFGASINNFLAPYANSLGAAVTVTATVASCAMFGNMLGKIILGFLNDKSVRLGMAYTFTCGIAGVLGIAFLAAYSELILYAGAFLFGNAYAAVSVQIPLTVRATFGRKDYAKIYSNISLVGAGSSAVASTVWGYVISGAGYPLSFAGVVILFAVSLIVGNVILQSGKKLPHTAD